MGILKNFVTPLHKQTKRNYVERMTNNKVYCSEVAKENLVMEDINTFQDAGSQLQKN